MKNFLIILLLLNLAVACKSSKSPQTDIMTEQEEKDFLREEALEQDPIEKVESNQSDLENTEITSEAKEHLIRNKNNISDSLVARLQKTACFGRCPIFTISLYNSGFATYQGIKWVENEGFYGAYVSPNIIRTIQNMASEINFFDLQDIYDTEGLTDLPSTITTIRIDETAKVVVNRSDGPAELKEFEDFFISLFADTEWDEDLVAPTQDGKN